MMRTVESKIIFSEAYADAAMQGDNDMRQIADLLETVRSQFIKAEDYEVWDHLAFPFSKFYSEANVKILCKLRSAYFDSLYEKELNKIEACRQEDVGKGVSSWTEIYAKAAVNFRDDFILILHKQRMKWAAQDNEKIESYAKLANFIDDVRWVDAFSIYEEILKNENLPKDIRAIAGVTLFEIVLYYFPEYTQAKQYLDLADNLAAEHLIVKRAWGEWYLKELNYQKAREQFLQVLLDHSWDYTSQNFIGDCFLAEGKLDSAEYWYNSALQNNFLQCDSYRRLINLFADKTLFPKKKDQILKHTSQIELICTCFSSRLVPDLADKSFFRSSVIYHTYRDVAAAFYNNGDLVTAEDWYRKAMALEPELSAAPIDLAYLRFEQKDVDGAIKLFEDVLHKDADSFEAHWGLAKMHEEKDQIELALKEFEKCLSLRPRWYDWTQNFIGNLYYRLKNFEKAIEHYKKATESNPAYKTYKQNLTDAMQLRAEQLEATDAVKAEELMIKAAELNESPNAWNKLGNFYFKYSRFKEAVQQYEKAIQLNAAEPVYWENKGLASEGLKQNDEAEKSYHEAEELDKTSGRYLNRLGYFFFSNQKYQDSIDYYLRALEREPNNSVYLSNIALAYQRLQQWDNAIHYYELLLEKTPNDHQSLNSLGIIYYNKKDYSKAIEFYKRAIDISKEWIYYSNLALAYTYIHFDNEAIENYKRSIELNPNDYFNWNELGILYYSQRHTQEAIDSYKKSISLRPNDGQLYSNLGLALIQQGKADEAVKEIKEAPIDEAQRTTAMDVITPYLGQTVHAVN